MLKLNQEKKSHSIIVPLRLIKIFLLDVVLDACSEMYVSRCVKTLTVKGKQQNVGEHDTNY